MLKILKIERLLWKIKGKQHLPVSVTQNWDNWKTAMWVLEGMCSSLILDKQGLEETPVIGTEGEKQDITSQAVADGQHNRREGLQIGKERKM